MDNPATQTDIINHNHIAIFFQDVSLVLYFALLTLSKRKSLYHNRYTSIIKSDVLALMRDDLIQSFIASHG